MSVTSMSAMPAGRDQLGQVLGDRADEADLDAVRSPWSRSPSSGVGCRRLDLARWRRGTSSSAPPSGLVVGVVRRHHAVDQVVVALVELVVAHRRDLEAGLVERVDGRLVVLDERLERRGADQVTGGGEHRVGVLRPRSCLTAPASTAAPAVGAVGSLAIRPWKSLVPRIWIVAASSLGGVEPDDLRVVVGGPRTGWRRTGR